MRVEKLIDWFRYWRLLVDAPKGKLNPMEERRMPVLTPRGGADQVEERQMPVLTPSGGAGCSAGGPRGGPRAEERLSPVLTPAGGGPGKVLRVKERLAPMLTPQGGGPCGALRMEERLSPMLTPVGGWGPSLRAEEAGARRAARDWERVRWGSGWCMLRGERGWEGRGVAAGAAAGTQA